jgi:hypothetical protein
MLKFLSFLFCICLASGVHADERLIELKCQALVNFRDEAHVKHLSVENFVFEEVHIKSGSRVVNASGRCILPLDPLSFN